MCQARLLHNFEKKFHRPCQAGFVIILSKEPYTTCQARFVFKVSHNLPSRIWHNFANHLTPCAKQDLSQFCQRFLHHTPIMNCYRFLSEILTPVPSRIGHNLVKHLTQFAKHDLAFFSKILHTVPSKTCHKVVKTYHTMCQAGLVILLCQNFHTRCRAGLAIICQRFFKQLPSRSCHNCVKHVTPSAKRAQLFRCS